MRSLVYLCSSFEITNFFQDSRSNFSCTLQQRRVKLKKKEKKTKNGVSRSLKFANYLLRIEKLIKKKVYNWKA